MMTWISQFLKRGDKMTKLEDLIAGMKTLINKFEEVKDDSIFISAISEKKEPEKKEEEAKL